MDKLTRIIFIIVSTIFIGFFITTIFNFFDISIQTYGIYLLFTIALLLLFAFLPQKSGDIFNHKS